MYTDWLRVQKQQMVDGGKGRIFIPTLTAATYGEMDATAVLDGTLRAPSQCRFVLLLIHFIPYSLI